MRRGIQLLNSALVMVGISVLLAVCLFADTPAFATSHFFGAVATELGVVFRDSATQWMAFVGAAAYFVAFSLLLHQRTTGSPFWRASNPTLWLGATVTLVSLDYLLNYDSASNTTRALVVLGGATLGKGVAVVRMWRGKSGNRVELQIIVILVSLLVVGTLVNSDSALEFGYRGQQRWSGSWDNPNTYGLLMGVGVVLGVGQLLASSFKPQHQTLNLERGGQKSEARRWLQIAVFLTAGALMGMGLAKSYSRGAWIGALVGLGYLAWSWKQCMECSDSGPLSKTRRVAPSSAKSEHSKRKRVFVATAVIGASLLVLSFWNLRHTERTMIRRAFSVANVNDFSWKKRIAAYEGSLQMIAEMPRSGFGWNQPEPVYDSLYKSPKVDESMAIHSNDYFTLGTTLGIPALGCFLAYIVLSFVSGPWSVASGFSQTRVDKEQLTLDGWLRATCRAGVVVLLVGFWFDGGLFKLVTGATFWILLEMGKEA